MVGVFDGVVLAARALSREVKFLTYVVGHRFAVDEGGAGDVLDGQSDALEDRYFVVGGASGVSPLTTSPRSPAMSHQA